MLRITVHETSQQITFKLEGSLTGSWVMELEDCWRAASSNPAGRLIRLDLTEVDSVDSAGTYLFGAVTQPWSATDRFRRGDDRTRR